MVDAPLGGKTPAQLENVNYRVERVSNGYILHVTRGKDGPVTKIVFTSKVGLLDHLGTAL